MLSLLLTLLIVCLVVGVFYWIVTLLPLPAPAKQVAMVICAIILLVWMLGVVFGVDGVPWRLQLR